MKSKAASPRAGAPRSRAKGCLIAAGVTALVIVLLGALVAGLLFWKARSLRNQYTDTELKAVPVEETNAETARRLGRTFEQLQRAIKEGRAEHFTLTDLQMNQLVATVPALAGVRGRAHFAIVDGHLRVESGIPLGQVPGFQGRFLNGEFTLDLRLENGQLNLRVLDATVRGQPLPPLLMDRLRQRNLAEQALQNREFRQQIASLKSLRIEDGKLVLDTGR